MSFRDLPAPRTMRLLRFVAILPVIGLGLALAAFLWSFSDPPRAGHLDAYAASRIHSTCHFQSQCVIRVGELFEGNWDTFYEFGPEVSQAEVDQTLSPLHVSKGETQRLLVLTRQGRLITTERENAGAETPLDGEVEFGDERHRDQHIVQLSHSARLQVTSFPTNDPPGHTGTFYVLSPVD